MSTWMRIGQNLRHYAKQSPRCRSCHGARFYSSKPDLPPIITPSEAVKWVIVCSVANYCYEWYCFHRSKMYEEWKGKKKMQKMFEELDRKKKESPEAYLEMIHREIDSLMQKLKHSERKAPAVWEVSNYEREIAALKSKFYSWYQREDTTAPQV